MEIKKELTKQTVIHKKSDSKIHKLYDSKINGKEITTRAKGKANNLAQNNFWFAKTRGFNCAGIVNTT